LYQAENRTKAWRVTAKVEFRSRELSPAVGFIVTNLGANSRAVVRFHNKRGAAEQRIKERKQAVKMTHSICHWFRSNEVRLCLSVIADNPGSLWRRLPLTLRVASWSVMSLQQRLVNRGGRFIKQSRHNWPLPAESHLPRRLFGTMVLWIESLPVPAGWNGSAAERAGRKKGDEGV
jgi:hypothetical protein